MKKLLSLFIVFALAFCMVACNTENNAGVDSQGTSVTSAQEGESSSDQGESVSSEQESQSSEQEGGDSSSQSGGDSSSGEIIDDFEEYLSTVYVDDGEDFVILNFTDFQLHDGNSTHTAFNIIDELVEKTDPDLITVLGDTAEDNGEYATKNTFAAIVEHIDALGIPWAPIYGNHDNDNYREESSIKDVTSEWINNTFLSSQNCLFKVGPDNVTGNGNYVVNVVNSATDEIVKTLVFVDSGTSGVDTTHVAFYEQAILYGKSLNGGTTPESVVYMHIPLPEYGALYESGNYEGVAGEVPHAHGTSAFFAKIKELGSTKHVMCGHDHLNSFYGEYQGVNLMYCLKSSDGDYYNINQLGGTTLTIGEETTFEYHFLTVDVEIVTPIALNLPVMKNFKNSGKALTFDYKAVDNENNSGSEIAFTLWRAGWEKRVTELITVNVVGDTIKDCAGKIEDIGDGWRRLTINCSEMYINTGEGAIAGDTVGMIYFNIVDHAFLMTNLGFTDEMQPGTHDDAVEVSESFYYFNFKEGLENFGSSDKALVFDYKPIDKPGNKGTGFQFTLWGDDWTPPRRTGLITVDVVSNTIDVGRIEELEDGWYRVIIPTKDLPINTAEGATGSQKLGSFIFNVVDHAFLIDEVGFTNEYNE